MFDPLRNDPRFQKLLRGKAAVKRLLGTLGDNLSTANWSLDWIVTIDGRTIWIADADRVTMSPGIPRTKCRFWLSNGSLT
jgi:hypothetical protein